MLYKQLLAILSTHDGMINILEVSNFNSSSRVKDYYAFCNFQEEDEVEKAIV